MRGQRNLFQKKGQGKKKIPGKSCNGTEINNLSHKEFKALVVRVLTELGKAECGKNFNKQLENIERAIRAEDTVTKMKNTLTRRNK